MVKLRLNNRPIEFMFGGINIFQARLKLILARAARRVLKWAVRLGPKTYIFMPNNINSTTIIITLEGNEKIKSSL